MRTLYLMRHGALAPNPQRRFIGQSDSALSALGHAQARQWREHWGQLPFAAIICSPLHRCRETAAIIAAGSAIPIIPDHNLREIHLGAWEGLTPQEVEEQFPGQYALRGQDMAHFRPAGGESFADVARRVIPTVDAWRNWAIDGSRAEHLPLLLIAHAGVNRCILARHMALPLESVLRIPQPFACCTCLSPPEVS